MIDWARYIQPEVQTKEDGTLNVHLNFLDLPSGTKSYLVKILTPVILKIAQNNQPMSWMPKLKKGLVGKLSHEFRLCETFEDVASLIRFRESVECHSEPI